MLFVCVCLLQEVQACAMCLVIATGGDQQVSV